MAWRPPGFSVLGILQARILEWVAMPPLQGMFPTQASNSGLLHGRQILYHLGHQVKHSVNINYNYMSMVIKIKEVRVKYG